MGKWTICAKLKDTEAHIDDLQKGHSYQFRVKAVNQEGASDPLSTKDFTLAKNPYGTIYVILNLMQRVFFRNYSTSFKKIFTDKN